MNQYPIQLQVIENQIYLNDAFCRLLNAYEGEELAYTIRSRAEIEIYKAKFFSACKAVITDNRIALSPAYLIEPLVYQEGECGFLEAHFQKDRFVLTPGVTRCRRCFATEDVEKHEDSEGILCSIAVSTSLSTNTKHPSSILMVNRFLTAFLFLTRKMALKRCCHYSFLSSCSICRFIVITSSGSSI